MLVNELRVTDYQKKALKRLKLETVKDLLWHFPTRYEHLGELKTIADAVEGEKATFVGKISNLKLEKTWRKKMNIARGVLNDGTGTVNITWFHQPFIATILKNEDTIFVSGKIQRNKNGLYLANPTYSKQDDTGLRLIKNRKLLAIYPETRGISSLWFRFNIQKLLQKIISEKELIDIVPTTILKQYNLPSLKDSLIYIHTPQKEKDAEAARKRFSFEEIFLIQLSRLKAKNKHKKHKAFNIDVDKDKLSNFIKKFSFQLTNAQQQAIDRIVEDIQKDEPMSRFLEGDVGSGKTAIAAAISFTILENGLQTIYMAPTEVLAKQLFESFMQYFVNSGAKIGLLTSSEARKFPSKIAHPPAGGESTHLSKARLLKWVAEGEIDILIGTHSLIQDRVKFSIKGKTTYENKKLALTIIDEQHRFGTNQRAALVNKKNESDIAIFPHFLSMSATPIPRTLALTIYGDLDLTILDEMPPGRKKIITEIVSPHQREIAYEKIREEIKKGRQAYIICPRIDTSENDGESLLAQNMKTVKEEYERLSKDIFPEYNLDMLYGKMSSKEKEQTMKDFSEGVTNILIATSVVEVGVNVPNATSIIIEGAERFGLAQLHQLRGRVLRSTHQPYCFIFTESKTEKTRDRLSALKKAKNGFELAEYDLQFRGPGELSGKKQWGISDVGMDALKNIKMVEAARTEAQNILEKDSELKNHPELNRAIKQKNLSIHFE